MPTWSNRKILIAKIELFTITGPGSDDYDDDDDDEY